MTLLAASAPDDTFLRDYAETRGFSAGRPGSVKVTPDGRTALYLRGQARDVRQALFALDLATGAERTLVTPEGVLQGASESLSVVERARLERQRITARGFTSFKLSPDGQQALVTLSGRLYLVALASGAVTALKTGEGVALDATFSPDSARIGYVQDHDVQVLELKANARRAVTRGGTEVRPHGLAEFVAQEEMGRFSGFWFSPDSQAVAFQETDHAGVERFGVADPMHPELEANRFYYPRPGKPNAAVRLGVQKLAGGPVTWAQWDAAAFPYLATVRWKDGPLTLVVQNREQTREQVLAVDVRTGKTTVLLTEEDPAWLNLDQTFPLWWQGQGFFWLTERHGAPEVELRGPDGALKGSWVSPDAGLARVAGFDPGSRSLFFLGGPDPTQSLLYRVVDGGAPLRLSPPGLAEESATLSGEERFLVVTRLTPEALAATRVASLDGATLQAIPSVALEPDLAVNAEVLKLDGEPGSWAQVVRPKDFVPGRKYPVVLEVYGGPHAQQVHRGRTFSLRSQWLANQGFLVVKADGRGTPRRGRAWERAIARDFATLIVADQVTALRGLAARVPELDLDRVGVIGWSFGGYLAGLLGLSRPDVVKSAVLGAPVVDWHDYDTHYTERYLGLPDAQPRAYQVSSLLTYVQDARRPLLLLHGTADDNVYFLHTLKLSDALFRAGVPHAVLPLANFTHQVADPVVLQRQQERVVRFFRETL